MPSARRLLATLALASLFALQVHEGERGTRGPMKTPAGPAAAPTGRVGSPLNGDHTRR